ncbi:MAG: VCBS repeat-containing protein [Planctomycetota bacterium]
MNHWGRWIGVVLIAACCACSGKVRTATPGHRTGKTSDGPGAQGRPSMTFTLCAENLPTQGMWKCDPLLADVNGDGALDLAGLPRLGHGPRVWLGDGKSGWKESSNGLTPGVTSCGGGLAVSDLNRDGFPDLAVADHCQGVFTYLGNGQGEWRLVTQGLHPEGANNEERMGSEDLDVGDINGDGNPDIVTSAQDDGGITVYFGDGSGSKWVQQPAGVLPTYGWGNRVLLTDINADGMLDIVASHGEGPRAFLGNGKGEWTASSKGMTTPMIQGLFSGIAAGDVNGDKRVDLVFANWVDGPEVFLQEADGSWREAPSVFPEMLGGAVGVTLGDLDLDGDLDMVTSGRLTDDVGYVYGLFVLEGDGRGGWRYLRQSGLPETGLSTAWGVAMGDVSGDGVPDIAFSSGGIVAADPKHNEPVMPTRLQVWCTHLPPAERAVLAAERSIP